MYIGIQIFIFLCISISYFFLLILLYLGFWTTSYIHKYSYVYQEKQSTKRKTNNCGCNIKPRGHRGAFVCESGVPPLSSCFLPAPRHCVQHHGEGPAGAAELSWRLAVRASEHALALLSSSDLIFRHALRGSAALAAPQALGHRHKNHHGTTSDRQKWKRSNKFSRF